MRRKTQVRSHPRRCTVPERVYKECENNVTVDEFVRLCFCFLLGGSLGCKAQLRAVARWGVRARTGSSPEGAQEAGPVPACGEPPALLRAPGVPARAYGRPLARPRGWSHARAWAAARAQRVALPCRWRRQRNKCAFAPLEGALRVGRGQSHGPRA